MAIQIDRVMEVISRYVPKGFAPKVGMMLGSGLSSLAEQITDPISIPYQAIPGLQTGAVSGHASLLVLGKINGVQVVCLRGRLHRYEGVEYESIRALVHIVRHLGCSIYLATAAVGSLRPEVGPGELTLISDHINFQPGNPLVGPNDESIGPRFVSMDDAYDVGLQDAMQASADRLNIPLSRGVYISTLGPSFETPAEIRAFKTLGADLVGMSVVPEVILARHCGLRVAGLAVITNLAAGMSSEKITHEGTLHYGEIGGRKMAKLILSSLRKVVMQWSEAIQAHVQAVADVKVTKGAVERLLSVIDLTSLNAADTEASIASFLDDALAAPIPYAAVCVLPRFVQLAADACRGTRIHVASVANFPEGSAGLDQVLLDIGRAIQDGANEIDVVFPYQRYLAGEKQYAATFVAACRAACGDNVQLKVILETGALSDPAIIADASYDVLVNGADFIKTSTGKMSEGATLEAAATMLLVIKHASTQFQRPLGLKVSGGIRETQQAARYMALADNIMGANWATAATFRIGASQLANELLKAL